MVHTTCAVKNCMSSSHKDKTLRFHQFPRTDERCKLWVEACRRHDLVKKTCDSLRNTYICSVHFEKRMYGKKSLKKTALPTLLLLSKESTYTQTDPEMIQTTPVVKLEHGLDVDANTTPFIKIEPGLSNEQVKTIPLAQTNQVVIKIEEGKGDVKAEPGSLVLPPAKNPPNEPQINVTATPTDPLGIEVDDEPLEYLQSTKKKLWNTIISLREKLKAKNSKIKRLQEHNRRMRLKIQALEAELKGEEDSTVENEEDMDCDFVEKDDE